MEELLVLVPPGERARIRTKAMRLAEEARRRAGPMRVRQTPRLYETLPVTVAAIAPALDDDRLLLLVRYGIWSVLLDDHLDAPDADPAELRATEEQIGQIIDGTQVPAKHDYIARELAEILAGLRARHHEALMTRFTDAVRDAVAAAVGRAEERTRFAGSAAGLPAAEDYLDVASRDVNYRSFALALLLVIGETPSPEVVALWDAALPAASAAVRLANDLRSVRRDQREGRLNILTLRTRAGTHVTQVYVRRQVQQYVLGHLTAL